MSNAALGRLSERAKLLAVLLFAASGVRFATVGLGRAIEGTPQPVKTTAPAVPKARRVPQRLRDGGAKAAASGSRARKRPETRRDRQQRAAAKLLRVETFVSAGPPRSEVFVKGRRVGSTPFLGEISCTPGSEIKIEIVPPKGMPLNYTRTCRPGASIRVEE